MPAHPKKGDRRGTGQGTIDRGIRPGGTNPLEGDKGGLMKNKTQWHATNCQGVRYREHPTRKYGALPDRYYVIRYRVNGRRIEEPLGWASSKERWTPEKARDTLAVLKANQKFAEGPQTLKEQRAIKRAEREAQESEKARQEKEAVTFKEFFDKVYYPHAKAHKKTSTHDKEEIHARLWLNPVIGDKPIRELKRLDLERVKKRLLDAKKSPRTVQYVFATFRQVWNMARGEGLVSGDSPTRQIKPLKFDNRRQRFLTLDEEKALLDNLAGRSLQVHDMSLLALRTGMRASEIFNLKWSHIDKENGRILIVDPKSGKSRHAFMTEQIKAMFAQRPKGEPGSYVFRSTAGQRITEVSDTFKRAVDELKLNKGIKDRRLKVTFHSTRHTHASRLAESGVDLYAIKTLLGHSTIQLTERYSHLSNEALEGAVKTLEQKTEQGKPDNLVEFKGRKKKT